MTIKKEYKRKIQTIRRLYAQPMFSDADMWCIRNIRNGENEYIDSYVVKTVDIL